MFRAPSWFIGAAAALSTACATSGLITPGGPESLIQLRTEDAVGWEPAGPYPIALELYNASSRGMNFVGPLPETVQVKVFRVGDGSLACQTPAPSVRQYEGWAAKPIGSASGKKITIDVWPYCRSLGEGYYRYEAVLMANDAQLSGASIWTGRVGPQGGRIVIRRGIGHDAAAIRAALAQPEAPSEAGATPPALAAEGGAAAPAGGTAAPAAAPVNVEEIRACVDRELAGRGLNAYADPQGTSYPDRPPVDEDGRILYVASRQPEIRAACRIPGF